MIRRLEIEERAKRIRHQYQTESYGIKDIFNLVEKMDVDLIRYPFGKDILCGLAMWYEGKHVIVSNSSEILSREIFTIAHELAHVLFDLQSPDEEVKVDFELSEKPDSLIEKRADYFAACLLMPDELIRDFIKYELKKEPRELRGIDIVRIQVEFNVSYAASVKRLKELNTITQEHVNTLYDDQKRYSSERLFQLLNVKDELLKATNDLRVPAVYIDYVISNYDNGQIPFSSLKKAFDLIQLDAESFKNDNVKASATPETNLKDIIGDFE